MFTVGELIERLKDFDEDDTVLITFEDSTPAHVDSIDNDGVDKVYITLGEDA
jgi:hypothetical protein